MRVCTAYLRKKKGESETGGVRAYINISPLSGNTISYEYYNCRTRRIGCLGCG